MPTFGLLEIAAILAAFLGLLLAGGVWVAISLLAVGWLGMMMVGGIPAGSVLATTIWARAHRGSCRRCRCRTSAP